MIKLVHYAENERIVVYAENRQSSDNTFHATLQLKLREKLQWLSSTNRASNEDK